MTLVHSEGEDAFSVPTEITPKTVADVLAAAADQIEKPGGWTRGFYGRTADGAVTDKADRATCFCVMGAIAAAAGEALLDAPYSGFKTETAEPALTAFRAHIGHEPISFWNDSPYRTQAEVVAALRAAAAKAAEASQ